MRSCDDVQNSASHADVKVKVSLVVNRDFCMRQAAESAFSASCMNCAALPEKRRRKAAGQGMRPAARLWLHSICCVLPAWDNVNAAGLRSLLRGIALTFVFSVSPSRPAGLLLLRRCPALPAYLTLRCRTPVFVVIVPGCVLSFAVG